MRWAALLALLWAGPAKAVTLIPLNGGMQMTCQFVNDTGGAYQDSQVYVMVVGLNSANQLCWVDQGGNLNPCVPGQNAQSYFFSLAAINGFQFPANLSSGRLYVAYGAPLDIAINTAANGSAGIAYPNIENPSDPSINRWFDWIEFAIVGGQIWCNTTQVDMFGIPMVMQLYAAAPGSPGYALNGTVGLTETAQALYDEYSASVPPAFAGLEGPYRILAPVHGSFNAGGANAGYFDAAIAAIWARYSGSPFVATVGASTYSGLVGSNGLMAFSSPGDPNTYTVAMPSTTDVWEGAGRLATGNPVELALEAQICAAFHRHVMDQAAQLYNPSAYYLADPADHYAQFWHQHSINHLAYGFCYDDVNNQSSSLTCPNPRGLVISIGNGAGPPTPPTATPTATPISGPVQRVNAGGPAYSGSLGRVWAVDQDYSGGTAATGSYSIGNTADPTLYQTQRWGAFSYTLSVPPGSYQVTLQFAETYWTGPGQRIFDVSINGTPVLTHFDIVADCGAADRADDKVFSDISPNAAGQIVLQFGPASVDQAVVCALSVLPMPTTATPDPSASASPSASPSLTPTRSPTPTATQTATQTPTPSQSFSDTPTPTQTHSETMAPSPSATASVTWALSASASPTVSASASPSAAWTATSSPTATASPSAPRSPSATAEPSATASASPWSSPSPSPCPTASATATASRTPSLNPSPSATPALKVAPATATPPGGGDAQGLSGIGRTEPVPNPNPGSIRVQLTGFADEVELRVYSSAMVCVGENRIQGCRAGWVSVALPAAFLRSAPNGTYYYRATCERGGARGLGAAPGRFSLLR